MLCQKTHSGVPCRCLFLYSPSLSGKEMFHVLIACDWDCVLPMPAKLEANDVVSIRFLKQADDSGIDCEGSLMQRSGVGSAPLVQDLLRKRSSVHYVTSCNCGWENNDQFCTYSEVKGGNKTKSRFPCWMATSYVHTFPCLCCPPPCCHKKVARDGASLQRFTRKWVPIPLNYGMRFQTYKFRGFETSY